VANLEVTEEPRLGPRPDDPVERERAIDDIVRELTTRAEEAEAANECDRSKLHTAIRKMVETLRGREWLASGRGCYEYDDDRWYKEFGEAINEIHEALDEIRKVAQSFHASTCKNGTTQTIAEARIDIKKKLAIAELALHIAAESSSQRIARGCGGMIDPPTTEEWVKILKEKAAEQLEKNSS